MPRFFVVLLWVVAGHAALAGLGWAFINVPESNALAVALSAVLALAIVGAAAWIEMVAILAWDAGLSGRDRWWRGLSAFLVFVVAALLFGGVWMATGAGYQWLDGHRGEIDAWTIAQMKTTETAWIHRTAAAMLFFIRWILGVAVATTLLAFGVRGGFGRVIRLGWLRAAAALQTIGATGIAFVLLIAMPLRFADWRPPHLPPTWVEPAFVAAKLGVLFVVANAGWALILRAAAAAEARDEARQGSGLS
jgi:hypothetical protein